MRSGAEPTQESSLFGSSGFSVYDGSAKGVFYAALLRFEVLQFSCISLLLSQSRYALHISSVPTVHTDT